MGGQEIIDGAAEGLRRRYSDMFKASSQVSRDQDPDRDDAATQGLEDGRPCARPGLVPGQPRRSRQALAERHTAPPLPPHC